MGRRRYRRTVSFPNPGPTFPARPATKSLHVRSVSLPSARPSPLIPQLRDEINELRAWDRDRASSSYRAGSGRVCDGLARLNGILDSLDDVLQLPLTQGSLSSSTTLVEKLLEDFLQFVDVYGIFRASMLGLKQELSGAQVAIRRKDVSKMGLHVKAQKKIANEIGKLVPAVGSIPDADHHPPTISTLDEEEELRHVIRDVQGLTKSMSAGLFRSVSSSFGPGQKPIWDGLRLGLSRRVRKGEGIEEFEEVVEGVEILMGLRKKGEKEKSEEMRKGVLRRMQELEDCIGEIERGSEKVFRSLISTRVSLLNILTHA